MPFALNLNPLSDKDALRKEKVEKKLLEIQQFKQKIYFIEFEDLFEYLYLAHQIIETMQETIKNLKQKTPQIKSYYIFAAAVSDFYIPKSQMVKNPKKSN